jgi:hypothetical protein
MPVFSRAKQRRSAAEAQPRKKRSRFDVDDAPVVLSFWASEQPTPRPGWRSGEPGKLRGPLATSSAPLPSIRVAVARAPVWSGLEMSMPSLVRPRPSAGARVRQSCLSDKWKTGRRAAAIRCGNLPHSKTRRENGALIRSSHQFWAPVQHPPICTLDAFDTKSD